MKITIPESLADISLEQFQKYDALLKREDLNEQQLNIRKLEIFTGLKYKEVRNISEKDITEIVAQIDLALTQTTEFKPFFKIKDVEFGFIPNLDKITYAEYVDMKTYQVDVDKMHKLMAILFRPVLKKDMFGNYKIEPYKGTEKRAEVMKYMPMSAVNGALVFFSNLASELYNYTLIYMQEEQVKEEQQQNTLRNGDGLLV